ALGRLCQGVGACVEVSMKRQVVWASAMLVLVSGWGHDTQDEEITAAYRTFYAARVEFGRHVVKHSDAWSTYLAGEGAAGDSAPWEVTDYPNVADIHLVWHDNELAVLAARPSPPLLGNRQVARRVVVMLKEKGSDWKIAYDKPEFDGGDRISG